MMTRDNARPITRSLFGTVDIYQVHNLVNLPNQLSLLERFKADGKVLAIGATHYQDPAFADLADAMRGGRLHFGTHGH